MNSRTQYNDNFTKGKQSGRFSRRANPERRDAFFAANFAERVRIHEQVASKKSEAMRVRQRLAEEYLADNTDRSIEIPFEKAAVSVDLEEATRAAREEALPAATASASQVDNKSLEFPMLAGDFAPDSPAIELATSPLLLAPIVRYFGRMPVFFNMFVTRAVLSEFTPNTSHMFHLDPEDVVSHKVFIHLTDVDEDGGPLHVLEADASRRVLDDMDYRAIDRLTDDDVRERVGWDPVVRFAGPAGTAAFADTCRCLHFGGRPRAEGRPVRYTMVYQYLLPTSFLFPIDGDCEHPRFFPQLEPTGDDHWDALIGARFT